ncbi:MAG: outer membrane beta-barrel protein [Nitrospira sp.]
MIEAKRSAAYVIIALMCGGSLCMPSPASGEWFGDLYGGVAFPQNITAQFDQSFPQPAKAARTYHMDSSPAFGIRVGKWLGKPHGDIQWPLGSFVGVAGDVSYFQRKAEGAKFDVVPISVLLMLRIPLYRSDDFPAGRIQPYLGIGPSMFAAQSSVDSPAPNINPVHHGRTDFGFDVRAGLAWQVHKYVAFFTEYRFTDVELHFRGDTCTRPEGCGTAISRTTTDETKVSLMTHHILFGLRF